MIYAKQVTILAVIAICWFYFYPTESKLKRWILEWYNKEIQTLSGNIQKNRSERERLYNEWKQKDNTLSGSINDQKAQISKLQDCINIQSMECKKQWIIPQVNASERDNATPRSGIPEQIQCSIGTGSHDIRSLAKNYPWVAGWKNNNVSGITLGSKSLEKEFNNAWILWYVWTARPKNEWWNYYWFPDLENGMKAKILIIKRSYKEYTIQKYLRIWGTDTIDSQMDLSRLIWSLDDNELISLIKSQIQKESGQDMSKYVFDKIITCK